MQDAPIEEIARAVGIGRGQVYRHFASKDELFVLTVTSYLDELEQLLSAAAGSAEEPPVQAERCLEAFAGFCRRYPAFLDCSMALMHRPARELQQIVAESVWLRLGQAMAGCIGQLADVLRAGTAAGRFAVEDADHLANVLWTQVLGAMHLGRIGVGVRRQPDGTPALFPIEPESLVRACVASALATLGSVRSAGGG